MASGSICLVGKTFEFAASHRLFRADWSVEENYKVFGKCANPHGHGHNYKLEVTVSGPIDETTGMVMDASKLSAIIEEHVMKEVDHKNLDQDVSWLKGQVTTVENLVSLIWDRIFTHIAQDHASLYELKLWETSRIYAVRRSL